MAIFIVGNAACALAPSYGLLMAARVLTALAHGTFFGVGSVVATDLVAQDKRATAIAVMFTGLTIANILGVPFGTWLGQHYGWRTTFWAVTVIGLLAFAIIAAFVPRDRTQPQAQDWRADLKAISRPAEMLRAADHGAGLCRRVRGLHLHCADADRDHRLFRGGRLADPRSSSAAGWWSATFSAGSWRTGT